MEVYSSSYRLGAGLVTVIGSTRRVGSWLEMEVYRLGTGLITVIGSTRRVGSWLEMEVYSSSYRLGAGPVTVTQGALEELGAGWRWKCIDWELVLSQ